jgi:hypothetical protein
MKFIASTFQAIIVILSIAPGFALADGSGDPAPANEKDGKYFDKGGNPTYKIG